MDMDHHDDCSSCDEPDNVCGGEPYGDGPALDTVYPLNEEVEVPGTNGGLFKTVLVDGPAPDADADADGGVAASTKPPRGAKVTVHYVGTLAADGTQFDSSRDRGTPFVFTLGQGEVIKGWDTGVATMRKGEKAVLRCTAAYGYGDAGSPPKIPGGATLNFEVELLDWTKCEDISEARDMTIVKSITKEGTGYEKPDYESKVTCDVVATECQSGEAKSGDVGQAGATEFFRKEGWEVVVGDTDLPVGLEAALRSMKRGEKAVVAVSAGAIADHRRLAAEPIAARPNKKVFASSVDDSIPFDTLLQDAADPSRKRLRYEVTVKDFTVIQTWSFKGPEKLREGAQRRTDGNGYFGQGLWSKAEAKYRKAIDFLSNDYDLKEESEKAEAKAILTAVHSNLAQVYLNMRQPKQAAEECNKALEIDGANAKALFRRARALGQLDEWDEAVRDLTSLLDRDAENAAAKAELAAIKAKQRDYDKKMKARYAGMFGK